MLYSDKLKRFGQELAKAVTDDYFKSKYHDFIQSHPNVIELTFMINQDATDKIFEKFLAGYQRGTIGLQAIYRADDGGNDPMAFNLSNYEFLYKGQSIELSFNKLIVGEGAHVPDMIDILQLCVTQDTWNPDVTLS